MRKNNSEFDFELNQEMSFTPSGDDHLQIDGDEPKTEATTTVENKTVVPEPVENEVIETPVEPIEETIVETPVEEPTVSEEPKTETAEAAPIVTPKAKKKEKKNTKTEEKKKKGGFFPILLVVLALLCAGIWYFWSSRKVAAPVVTPVVDTTPVVKEEPIVEIPEEPMVIDTVPAPEPTPPPFDFGRVATKIKVPRNWLIGFRATPDEVLAIKTVAELSYVDSLPCGYYWIDDARKDGEKLFKIYIGPFDTKEEAEKVLPSIQAKRADAHVYTEDKRYKNN
ncbi:MAG: hypothetical protein MJ197_06225 [Bacteroidales bacterium]|nr:hypothetical protein [Bacteroidales bacterium]